MSAVINGQGVRRFPRKKAEQSQDDKMMNTYAKRERETHTQKKNARAILCARCARDLLSAEKISLSGRKKIDKNT